MKSALHQTTTHTHPLPAIGTIHLIPVSMLHPMSCSPFKIRDDDAMQELVLSIKSVITQRAYFSILNGENISDIRFRYDREMTEYWKQHMWDD